MAFSDEQRALKTATLKSREPGLSGATWVGVSPIPGVSATQVQAVLEALAARAGAAAASVPYGGSAGLAAKDVEAALDELDLEKAPNEHNHDTRYYTETEADTRFQAAGTVPDHNLFSADHPDVLATDVPADGEVLTYSGAAGKWVSQPPAAGSASALPPGSVTSFAGAQVPAGWLPCDGAAVSRTTYPALFNAIGATYGAGDGSTTFDLPDARGRAAIGATGAAPPAGISARAPGDKPGAETHALTTPEMPAHGHATSFAQVNNTAASGAAARLSGAGTDATLSTNSQGGGGAHNNVSPAIVFQTIIKT